MDLAVFLANEAERSARLYASTRDAAHLALATAAIELAESLAAAVVVGGRG